MKCYIEGRTILLCTLVFGALVAGLVVPARVATLNVRSAATANAGPDITVYVGEAVRLDGGGSYGTIRNSRWATGDGHTVDSILKAPHVYKTPGTYTAALTVFDPAGAASTDTATVTVRAIDGAAGNIITLNDTGNPDVNRQNLQQAINTAAQNPNATEIVVPAGFVANDTIYIPTRNKAFGTYVTIRSSRSGELPVGTRVTRADRSKMFRINARPPDPGAGAENFALQLHQGSNYFRFVGLDIVRVGAAVKNDLVGVDLLGGTTRPSHFILDRVILDGNGTETLRGFAPNGSEFSLLDSSIYDIKARNYETKAIGMWTGAGNLAVVNNYLEGASINTLIGGSYTDTSNMMDGIVFRGNHSFKNPEWVNPDGTGRGYGVKNQFELKAGRNVVADDNVFENNWADGQQGASILFTVRGDGQPMQTIRNVSFRRNTVRNSLSGVNFLPIDYMSASTEAESIFIEHNRFLDIAGRGFILLPSASGGGRNIHIKHNTVRMRPGAGQVILMDGGGRMQAFIESNDFGYAGEYGVTGSGYSEGIAGAQQYLTADSTFRNNLMSFSGRSSAVSLSYALWRYPAEFFAMYFSFTASDSYNADGTPLSHLVGTDGLVVGVGNGAVLPPPAPPSPTPTPTPTPAPPAGPTPTPVPGTPVNIATSSLPLAIRSKFYHQELIASGGSGRYVWSLTGGLLPAGLLLDPSTGRLSGKPRARGSWSFNLTAADAQNSSLSAYRSYTLTVR